MKEPRKIIFLIIKFGIAAGLITYLFLSGKLRIREVGKGLENYKWIFLSIIMLFAILNLGIVRWRLLLFAQGIRISFWEGFRLTFIGQFFSTFMPGATGGDLIKAYYISRLSPKKKHAAVTSVFLDRAIGLFALIGLATLAMIISMKLIFQHEKLFTLAIFIIVIFIVGVLIGLFVFSKRLKRLRPVAFIINKLPFQKHLKRVSDALYLYRGRPGLFIATILISLACHTIMIFLNYSNAKALGLSNFKFSIFFFIVPICLFVNALPFTPGGIGTGEFAYREIFNHVGLLKGAEICVLMRLVVTGWGLLGLVFYLMRKNQ